MKPTKQMRYVAKWEERAQLIIRMANHGGKFAPSEAEVERARTYLAELEAERQRVRSSTASLPKRIQRQRGLLPAV